MSEFLMLRQISQDFRRLSSAFLRTKDSDGLAYVKRLYNYINQEQTIKKYIDNAYAISDYDCNNFIVNDAFSRDNFNIPDNEVDHVKAMYDLLESLVNSQPPIYLRGLGWRFFPATKGTNEAIQAFLDKAFKPLIDYITASLSKEMMSLEQNIPTMQVTQNIEKVIGTANAGQHINSVNYSIQQTDLVEVLELLNVFRTEIEASTLDLDAIDKEFVLDDLKQMEEQVNTKSPDQTRIKKAMSGVKKFLEAVTIKAAATTIVSNAPAIIQKGSELLNRFECITQC